MIDDIYSIAEQEKVRYYLDGAGLPSDIATVNSVIHATYVTGYSTLYIVTQIGAIANAYSSQTENEKRFSPGRFPETGEDFNIHYPLKEK